MVTLQRGSERLAKDCFESPAGVRSGRASAFPGADQVGRSTSGLYMFGPPCSGQQHLVAHKMQCRCRWAATTSSVSAHGEPSRCAPSGERVSRFVSGRAPLGASWPCLLVTAAAWGAGGNPPSARPRTHPPPGTCAGPSRVLTRGCGGRVLPAVRRWECQRGSGGRRARPGRGFLMRRGRG